MTQKISATELRAMLIHVSQRMEQEEARLNSLDAAVGDGDHGITMRLGFHAVQKRLAVLPDTVPVSAILQDAGVAFMDTTGGAIGVILGRMLMAGGKSLEGVQEIGPPEFKNLLVSMEAGAMRAGKASPGDRTILDALNPAVRALESTSGHDDLLAALSKAANAAEAGAQNTSNMLCRVGRASRLGDRVIGHPDPGAVSFSIILRSMEESLKIFVSVA